MKSLFSLLLISFLFSTVAARENPFEPTDTFEEKQKEFFEKIEEEKRQKEEQEQTARLQEELLLKREKELQELELQKQQELQRLSDLEMQKQQEMEELNKLQKKRAVLQQDTPKIVLAPKKNIQNIKNFKALPFVTIQTMDNALLIFVDTKFKLKNQDILKKEKKLLFDFRANTGFYTIRKELEHPHFSAYAIGAHRKKGFFRVVIDLKHDTNMYRETIDTKEGIIKIEKL